MNNSRNFDLLTLGQVLLRLSPPDNERLSRGDTFVKQVGGAELNVAVGAALLGLHTGVISKLPAHDIGSFMKGKIRSFGVSDDFFMYDQSSSARVGIYYYENGAYPRKPKVIYDRNNSSFFSLDINEIPEEVYTASKCFHTTGITLALNGDIRETTIEMIKRFKAAGTLVSFDVNFRGNLAFQVCRIGVDTFCMHLFQHRCQIRHVDKRHPENRPQKGNADTRFPFVPIPGLPLWKTGSVQGSRLNKSRSYGHIQ